MLKRVTIALVAAVICGGAAGAQVRQREFRGYSPEILGQGGSYTAIAQGFESLFTNPAGISAGEPEYRAFDIGFWITANPDELVSTLGALTGDSGGSQSTEDVIIDSLTEQFTTNGFGMGASWRLGFVGERVGAGLEFDSDVYLFGETFPFGLEGTQDFQLSGAVGYSQPFFLGPVRLDAGLAMRPFVRQFAVVDSETAVSLLTDVAGLNIDDSSGSSSFTSLPVLSGFGVGFDTGVIAALGDFRLAFQLRNLFGTRVDYVESTFGDFLSAVSSGRLPQSGTTVEHIIPTEFSFGAAWRPDLGARAEVFDPVLHFEIRDPFGNTDLDKSRPDSFWTRVHIGSEVELLRFFDVRLGLNQGYMTYGFGIDIRILEFKFAAYTQEFGRYPGDRPVTGMAFEIVIP